MTYTQKVIEELRQRNIDLKGKDTDYAICKALGVDTSYMKKWTRSEKPSQFGVNLATKAALLLGVPPMLIISRISQETCKPEDKAMWIAMEKVALAEMDLTKSPTLKGAKKLKAKWGDFLILC